MLMFARIYQPARTAMQSGSKGTDRWVLEFDPAARREVEPLMGWTSSSDTVAQLKLSFRTKEEAEAYARRNGIAYRVMRPAPKRRRPKSYSTNFASNRKQAWTH